MLHLLEGSGLLGTTSTSGLIPSTAQAQKCLFQPTKGPRPRAQNPAMPLAWGAQVKPFAAPCPSPQVPHQGLLRPLNVGRCELSVGRGEEDSYLAAGSQSLVHGLDDGAT